MKPTLALSLLFGFGQLLMAQTPFVPATTMRSVSGQFVIQDQRGATTAFLTPTPKDATLLTLEPSFLVVSCERIKQALYTELGADRSWKANINANIRPARSGLTVAQINVEKNGFGWTYRLDFPEQLDRTQFTRTLVQVLLLEMANRNAIDRSAEIPLWLTEGLTQRLLKSREVEIILASPTMAIGSLLVDPKNIVTKDPDPLANARRVLSQRPPPTIEELSWPNPEKFSRDEAEFFQGSTQLFVSELLKLKDSQTRLRTFVTSLVQFYNWQTAFLRTYQEQFTSLLALEKWWVLQASFFVGRDHQQLWTLEESALKLDALLHTAVTLRTVSGELPSRASVNLQTVIREWDEPRQIVLIDGKIQELAQARRRVAPEFMILVNDYATVLDFYLKERKSSKATFTRLLTWSPSMKKVALETLQQLEALDVRRAQIVPEANSRAASGTNAVSLLK